MTLGIHVYEYRRCRNPDASSFRVAHRFCRHRRNRRSRMRRAMRRRPMQRVGLISIYSPKESSVRAIGSWALSQGQSMNLQNEPSPKRDFRLYANAQRMRISDAARNLFLVGARSASPGLSPLRTPFCKTYLSSKLTVSRSCRPFPLQKTLAAQRNRLPWCRRGGWPETMAACFEGSRTSASSMRQAVQVPRSRV